MQSTVSTEELLHQSKKKFFFLIVNIPSMCVRGVIFFDVVIFNSTDGYFQSTVSKEVLNQSDLKKKKSFSSHFFDSMSLLSIPRTEAKEELLNQSEMIFLKIANIPSKCVRDVIFFVDVIINRRFPQKSCLTNCFLFHLQFPKQHFFFKLSRRSQPERPPAKAP